MKHDTPYTELALSQVPRLLGLLDREPHSLTYGSADREYWAWKFRDYPIGMLQTAVHPLALLWADPFPQNPIGGNPRVREWLLAVFQRTLAAQHANGSFDGYAPYDQDPGVTLGVIHGLLGAHRCLRQEFPRELEQRFLQSVRSACSFALPRPESHAFISNHWALFAVALCEAGELLDEERFRQRAREVIARILREQSPDGWYNEYGGPDPGYETLGVFYLAKYWQQTADPQVLASLQRSLAFLAHCIHPDGSLGGIYGSRHTALYAPGGFEILARQVPLAAAIAGFMRSRLSQGNVVTPATVDTNNLIPLLTSYLEAALAHQAGPPPPPLPCESAGGVRHFADSQVTVAAMPAYYAVANARKGGVCRVFDRRTATIVYEDAGYLVSAGPRRWNSQMLGLGRAVSPLGARHLGCSAQFALQEQPLPTAFRFLVLRALNLTLFRSVALGALIRKWIVRRLITGVQPGPLRLQRTITFEDDGLTIHDCLQLDRPLPVEAVARPRALTAIHMGSAKYFHPSELVETLQAPVAGMARYLRQSGRAECCFALKFRPEGGAVALEGDPESAGEILAGAGKPR